MSTYIQLSESPSSVERQISLMWNVLEVPHLACQPFAHRLNHGVQLLAAGFGVEGLTKTGTK